MSESIPPAAPVGRPRGRKSRSSGRNRIPRTDTETGVQRFILRIEPVDSFPLEYTGKDAGAYAYVQDYSLEYLARRLSVNLNADVMTDSAVYLAGLSNSPPVPPPSTQETL